MGSGVVAPEGRVGVGLELMAIHIHSSCPVLVPRYLQVPKSCALASRARRGGGRGTTPTCNHDAKTASWSCILQLIPRVELRTHSERTLVLTHTNNIATNLVSNYVI